MDLVSWRLFVSILCNLGADASFFVESVVRGRVFGRGEAFLAVDVLRFLLSEGTRLSLSTFMTSCSSSEITSCSSSGATSCSSFGATTSLSSSLMVPPTLLAACATTHHVMTHTFRLAVPESESLSRKPRSASYHPHRPSSAA
jgi:hypothetical protein